MFSLKQELLIDYFNACFIYFEILVLNVFYNGHAVVKPRITDTTAPAIATPLSVVYFLQYVPKYI